MRFSSAVRVSFSEPLRKPCRSMVMNLKPRAFNPVVTLSRVSYGLEITEQRLKQIEEAEDFLRSLGFVEFRVRHHGDIARIEVPAAQIQQITTEQTREKVTAGLKALGFKFITIDLQGFRSGSLNETLTAEEKQRNV